MPVDDEQLWAAVAEPGRRRVLDALVALGEATPTALAREVPFTRQAVSKHLSVLLEAAARAMAAAAARWDARLQAIKRLAEAEHREDPGKKSGV